MTAKRYKLLITPQTWIRTTQKDKIYFRIPEKDLRPDGLARKLRMIKYNEYKSDLRDTAIRQNFNLPDEGMAITFFIPVPQSWRPGKKKKYHLQKHQSKPDVDNLLKAFFDGLRRQDQKVWNLTGLEKRWINKALGHISITVNEVKDYQEEFRDPDQTVIEFPI